LNQEKTTVVSSTYMHNFDQEIDEETFEGIGDTVSRNHNPADGRRDQCKDPDELRKTGLRVFKA